MIRYLNDDLASFRSSFYGRLITPCDQDYHDARALWNGAIDRRPALIARCFTAGAVAKAISFARRRGLEIAVRGGGHNFAGSASCDGGMMIDLSEMRQVSIDPRARRALCGGGATWAQVDAATQAHGLATPGGMISHTGIGGLTLGGGFGWLTRRCGLTIDNLLSAQVVSADGRILRAAPDEHADLFWALRGGGGNFGVVTQFEYQLHEVGPLVHVGLFFWGIEQGVEALRFGRDVLKKAPEEMGTLIAGLSAPAAPFVPVEHQGAPGFAIAVVDFGAAEEHAEVVMRIRRGLPPFWDHVTSMPYTALQQMLDDTAPWGAHAYEKALYLDDLDDEAIATLCEHLPRKHSLLSFLPIFELAGAYTHAGEDATAFGGGRAKGYNVAISGVCTAPEDLPAERAWVREFWTALRPYARGGGSYINFMSEYETDRVRASYGPEKYERLARIKAEYDPENVFHRNANVQPAGAAALPA